MVELILDMLDAPANVKMTGAAIDAFNKAGDGKTVQGA